MPSENSAESNIGSPEFQDPCWIETWLKTALEKEIKNYEANPPGTDLSSDCRSAQAWGYVVDGCLLLEIALKNVLAIRGKEVPSDRQLLGLFEILDDVDQQTLRAYYDDYRGVTNHYRPPADYHGPSVFHGLDRILKTVEEFLSALDVETDHGPFGWRNFATVAVVKREMPMACIPYMHEIIYGCIGLYGTLIDPDRAGLNLLEDTYSWRQYSKRHEAHTTPWFLPIFYAGEHREDEDRIEILWGPDYQDRYDLMFIEGHSIWWQFQKIPSDSTLPHVDKRQELADFLQASNIPALDKTPYLLE